MKRFSEKERTVFLLWSCQSCWYIFGKPIRTLNRALTIRTSHFNTKRPAPDSQHRREAVYLRQSIRDNNPVSSVQLLDCRERPVREASRSSNANGGGPPPSSPRVQSASLETHTTNKHLKPPQRALFKRPGLKQLLWYVKKRRGRTGKRRYFRSGRIARARPSWALSV